MLCRFSLAESVLLQDRDRSAQPHQTLTTRAKSEVQADKDEKEKKEDDEVKNAYLRLTTDESDNDSALVRVPLQGAEAFAVDSSVEASEEPAVKVDAHKSEELAVQVEVAEVPSFGALVECVITLKTHKYGENVTITPVIHPQKNNVTNFFLQKKR